MCVTFDCSVVKGMGGCKGKSRVLLMLAQIP